MHLGLTQLWAASLASGKEIPQATAGPAWLSLDELSGTWGGPRAGNKDGPLLWGVRCLFLAAA